MVNVFCKVVKLFFVAFLVAFLVAGCEGAAPYTAPPPMPIDMPVVVELPAPAVTVHALRPHPVARKTTPRVYGRESARTYDPYSCNVANRPLVQGSGEVRTFCP